MTAFSDHLLDRHHLRRRLSFWRVLGIAALIIAVLGLGAAVTRGSGYFPGSGAHIARITISGLITGDEPTLKLFESLAESNASAVVVHIDSPGGTTTGSEAVYEGLRRLSAKKPTVTVVDGLAASGGYIAALGTDHIFARETSLVGSIGVLFQYPNVSRLLDTVGVAVETVRSSPLKAAPNGLEPTSPEARQAIKQLVDDSYDWFKRLVRERRGLNESELATVSDGRVHTGHQAIGVKLIDALGSEQEALAWLRDTKGVSKDLKVREWKADEKGGRFSLFSLAGSVARSLGSETIATLFNSADEVTQTKNLDGLLALWHP